MLEKLLAVLGTAIVAVIATLGYGGVVLLMAIESACIPLPSELIMPFAGYLVSTGRFELPLLATAGALGCNLGSVAAYAVGARGGRSLIVRWGRLVWLSPRDLDRAERFFARYGGVAVLIARLLPVVRTFIALPAGVARMPLVRFHLYTFLGSWPWCYGLAYIGMKLGQQWNDSPALKAWFHRFDAAIVVVALIGAAVFIRQRRRESASMQ